MEYHGHFVAWKTMANDAVDRCHGLQWFCNGAISLDGFCSRDQYHIIIISPDSYDDDQIQTIPEVKFHCQSHSCH